MANPLVQTKLYLPRLRRSLVTRPRLSGRLSRGSDARLTLISAPAGFDKTTLLTTWLAHPTTDNRAVSWLSAEPLHSARTTRRRTGVELAARSRE